MSWLTQKRFGIGAALALVAACSTPSVPIPPPDVDIAALRFSSPAVGQVVLAGRASADHAGARFYVLDLKTGDGVIATAAADGSFTAPPLAATVGDTAEVDFVRPDGVQSNATCVTVLIGQSLVGADCP